MGQDVRIRLDAFIRRASEAFRQATGRLTRVVERAEPSPLTRAFTLLGLCGVTMLVLLWCAQSVDFRPQVSEHFFFATHDPQFREELQILEEFPQPSQMIISARGDLRSDAYLDRVRALGEALETLDDVFAIQSLTKGPGDLESALASPFWQRVLVVDQASASNLLVFLGEHPTSESISQIERLVRHFDAPDFDLTLSGVPYIIELIRRHLVRDLRVFGLATLGIFSVLILVVFRSVRLAFGTVLTCVTAAALTFLICHALQIRMSMLTANLATIVAVLTLSHIVFMTSNWLSLERQGGGGRSAGPDGPTGPDGLDGVWRASGDWTPGRRALEAADMTLMPSFWSMVTTALGFLSLLFVEAEPLRRLGLSGVVGAPVAFLTAYAVFPWALWVHPRASGSSTGAAVTARPADATRSTGTRKTTGAGTAFRAPRARVGAALIVACCVTGLGAARLNADPSLLSYFAEGGDIREGLEYVDTHLGSSPLKIVVRDAEDGTFNTREMYQRLWDLHLALEQEDGVGSVVSLPLLVAEARRVPLAFLLPVEWILDILEQPKYHEVGTHFISDDRRHSLFMLLMKEGARTSSRSATVNRMNAVVTDHAFVPEMVGGVYMLQEKLSTLVVSSLLSGLAILLALFGVMVWRLTGTRGAALAVTVSIALIPLWLLGVIGLIRMPFDVISAPATNLAVSMGVDAMIHVMLRAQRIGRRGGVEGDADGRGWRPWQEACGQLWRPIVFSSAIVCAGFGIFGLSAFPPTQRFGLSIVIGTALAPLAALFVFPWLTVRLTRRSSEA